MRKPIKPANNSHSNIFGTEENAEPSPKPSSLGKLISTGRHNSDNNWLSTRLFTEF